MEYSKYIINPEDNIRLAILLTPILDKFSTDIPCKRDNCGPINNDLQIFLSSNGIETDWVRGFFRVDSLDILDINDLFSSERSVIISAYGRLNKDTIRRYVDSLEKSSQDEFYTIHHYFLYKDGLILDAAYDMFTKYTTQINKSNYVI